MIERIFKSMILFSLSFLVIAPTLLVFFAIVGGISMATGDQTFADYEDSLTYSERYQIELDERGIGAPYRYINETFIPEVRKMIEEG